MIWKARKYIEQHLLLIFSTVSLSDVELLSPMPNRKIVMFLNQAGTAYIFHYHHFD